MVRITVIIPTRRRASSLCTTLQCLDSGDRTGVRLEVIVVDNVGDPDTVRVSERFAESLAVRCLTESRPGKSYCLNRALDAGDLGDIVAVLDDDMSPESGWGQGVVAITKRWPNKGYYSGRSYVIWPKDVVVPEWAKDRSLAGWAFSVVGPKDRDQLVEPGRWVSGNHFWLRRSAIESRRFESPTDITLETHIEMSEPRLMLDLDAAGLGGVMGPDAVAGHRIQPELLDADLLRKRARRVGRGFAEVRMRPYRPNVKQAVLTRRHPTLSRAFCLLNGLHWLVRLGCVRALVRLGSERSFPLELRATERAAAYRELLRLAGRDRQAAHRGAA